MPGPVAFENDSARQASRRWIGSRDGGVGHVAGMLLQIRLEIVTETVVQGELARDLPAILDESGNPVVAEPRGGRDRDVAAVGSAHEEARVVESHGRGKRHAIQSRQSGFIRTEDHPGRRVAAAVGDIALQPQLAARFIGVVVAHPGKTDVGGGLVVGQPQQRTRADVGHPALRVAHGLKSGKEIAVGALQADLQGVEIASPEDR